MQLKKEKLHRRHKRVRAKIKGTSERPRLSVFRSNQHIYLQLIDDSQKKTLISSSDLEIKRKGLSKLAQAEEAGKLMAKKALVKKIKKVVFDRGGYKYHGRIKAAAEGARQAGLEF